MATEVMRAPDAGRVALPTLIAQERRRQRRRRLWWLLAPAVAVAAGLGLWAALRPGPVPLEARFRTQPVTLGDVLREVRATGSVGAVEEVSVGSEVSGRIATVEVDFNSVVKVGQVMARFDRASLEAQRAQSEAMVAAARAQLMQARLDVLQARRNKVRSDELHTHGALTSQEYEAAQTTADVAQARVEAAEAQLAAQEAANRLARTNLEHAVIRSPIDGMVITRNIDPGQTVASMLQTPVLFTVAADLKKMEVVAAVDESDIGDVKVGQKAVFTVNAWPDRTFDGVVTEVRNSPRVVQDVVTYGTVVSVQNDALVLRPGMTASVRVRTATAKDVLRVPNAALHFTPPGQSRQGLEPAVWVLAGGTLKRVAVVPGVSDGEVTAVSGSLTVADKVLVDLTPLGKHAYGLDHAL